MALAAPPAVGHPGHGPGTVGIGDFQFTPGKLTIAKGDQVIWFWNGPDTNHSVTSDGGQAESFDSDRNKAPALVQHEENDAYSYAFDTIGTYSYHCKVHPEEMKGTIEVIKAPPPDTTAPKLTNLRIDKARVRFKISEPAFVIVSIRRRNSKKQVRSAAAFVRSGKQSVHFRRKGLKAGPYKAVLTGEDDLGNKSRPRSVDFRVR